MQVPTAVNNDEARVDKATFKPASDAIRSTPDAASGSNVPRPSPVASPLSLPNQDSDEELLADDDSRFADADEEQGMAPPPEQ